MKRMATGFIGAALMCLAAAAAAAGAYKWVDENGKIHYSDAPPPDNARMVEETNVPVRPVTDQGPDVSQIAAAHPVALYVIPDCQTCDLVREYLTRRGVPFAETNVENDPQAQAAMKERVGALAVPTIIVGEKVMKGYVESLLEGELDAAGYPKTATAPATAPGQGAGAEGQPAGSGEQPAEGAPEPEPAGTDEAPAAPESAAAPEARDGQGY
jgi:glutaredoxin